MSTVKNPKEKKRLSLTRDRRNIYGANAKASRQNIPRSKQLRHKDERHGVSEVLTNLKGAVDEEIAVEAESLIAGRIIASRRRGFKKMPDQPLAKVLEYKRRKKNPQKMSSIKYTKSTVLPG